MNQHIKRLMGKTLDERFQKTWSTLTPADLERFVEHFSELLIRDCADTAYNHSSLTLGQGYTIAKDIKRHYGVEQ